MKPPRIRTGKAKPQPIPKRPAKPRAARPTLAQIKRIAGMRGRIAF